VSLKEQIIILILIVVGAFYLSLFIIGLIVDDNKTSAVIQLILSISGLVVKHREGDEHGINNISITNSICGSDNCCFSNEKNTT